MKENRNISILRVAHYLILDYQLRKGDSEGAALGTASALLSIAIFLNLASVLIFFENIVQFEMASRLLDWILNSETSGLYIFVCYIATCVFIAIYCDANDNTNITKLYFEEHYEGRNNIQYGVLFYLVSSPILFFILMFTYIL
ncbi:hypothetical protein FLL46_06965 [Aliikangiella coralliicola]|uniref:Uncharacterized protein n=1 Tax=Aliikangiella coralliicola TaxID=2592383 RepID=A0A545UFL2_9GAMM|nr:hypothetical protein FLL46_06965 [Aliikangiella coralliicola]